jgi:hypothetical protein
MLERAPTEQKSQDFRRPSEPAPEVIIALPKPVDLKNFAPDTQNEIRQLQEKIATFPDKPDLPN